MFEKRDDGRKYHLTILRTKVEDCGEYTIKVVKNEKTATAKLTVDEKAPEFISKIHDQKVMEKDTATFQCQLSKPNVQVG